MWCSFLNLFAGDLGRPSCLVFSNTTAPESGKSIPCFCKRVRVEDLGKNRHPACRKRRLGGAWLFVQANLILINHPHQTSLANSECAESERKTCNKSKFSNTTINLTLD